MRAGSSRRVGGARRNERLHAALGVAAWCALYLLLALVTSSCLMLVLTAR